MRKAFTMIEIVFVIAVLGILSAVAIPKMMNTTTQANVADGKNVLGIVRSALSTERQKRILRGDFTKITSLSSEEGMIFDYFSADGNGVKQPILTYPNPSCKNDGCWDISKEGTSGEANKEYLFYYDNGKVCTFTLNNSTLKGNCPILKSY